MSDEPDEELIEFATRLFALAREGATEQLAAYVDAGVEANLANQNGDTLVMLAAYHGHAATVAALLRRGADPNRVNDRGQTPLAGAVFKDEPEVIRALLAGGADPGPGSPRRWRRRRCSGATTCWRCWTPDRGQAGWLSASSSSTALNVCDGRIASRTRSGSGR